MGNAVKLVAQSPCYGLLPISYGSVTVSEIAHRPMTSIAPQKGKATALNTALTTAHGVKYPMAGRVSSKGDVSCQWFGHGHAMLIGAAPDKGLLELAGVTDQSDAWAVVEISGNGVEEVLARLVPMDLRGATFKKGHTARTMVQHMSAAITRVGPKSFEIMVMRSMARTLVHDLETAMQSVVARKIGE